ncbi:MAG: exodeoxyribonuclease-3 [Candidatus Omnitrophota bacterium]|jgi:exodeoxyribonuclease-3
MKIIGWNVNGIRAISKKGFLEWFAREDPDILCLQETKAHPDQLGDELLNKPGYHVYFSSAERKGYSGVAVYTKEEPESVEHAIGCDEVDSEGRTLILTFKKFILINIYYPNGGAGNKRVDFKLKYYAAFLKKVEKLRKKRENIVITGDVNTAHTEIDLARPNANEKTTGFLPEERAWVTKFLEHGYVDTFRHFNKEPGHYTWWDYKTRARERDVGWRIDYFFVTDAFLPQLKAATILKDVFGSDHCPISVEIDV